MLRPYHQGLLQGYVNVDKTTVYLEFYVALRVSQCMQCFDKMLIAERVAFNVAIEWQLLIMSD